VDKVAEVMLMYLDLPDLLTLDNGLRIVLMPSNESPGIHVRADVLMGSCDERLARDKGVCHLIEGLVWRRTKDFTGHQVSGMADSAGNLTGGTVHGTHTSYRTWAPTDDRCSGFGRALDMLDSVIFRPELDASDLEAEKKLAIQRIADRDSDATSYSIQAARSRAFPKHGIGYSDIGTPETVLNMKITRLREYVRGYHRPQTTVLGLAGRLPNFGVLEEVLGDHATGFVNKTRAANAIPLGRSWGPATPSASDLATETWNDRGRSTVSAVIPLPDDMVSSDDHVGLTAACRFIGRGRRSWLHERLVSKGIALTSDCGFERVPGAGWMWISVQTTHDKESSVIDAISEAASKVVDGHGRWSEGLEVIRRGMLADLRSRGDAEWLMDSVMDSISTDGAIPSMVDRETAIIDLDGKSVIGLIGRLDARAASIYVVRQ